jgi:hypothetical protein
MAIFQFRLERRSSWLTALLGGNDPELAEVAVALRRFQSKLSKVEALNAEYRRIEQMLNVQTRP